MSSLFAAQQMLADAKSSGTALGSKPQFGQGMTRTQSSALTTGAATPQMTLQDALNDPRTQIVGRPFSDGTVVYQTPYGAFRGRPGDPGSFIALSGSRENGGQTVNPFTGTPVADAPGGRTPQQQAADRAARAAEAARFQSARDAELAAREEALKLSQTQPQFQNVATAGTQARDLGLAQRDFLNQQVVNNLGLGAQVSPERTQANALYGQAQNALGSAGGDVAGLRALASQDAPGAARSFLQYAMDQAVRQAVSQANSIQGLSPAQRARIAQTGAADAMAQISGQGGALAAQEAQQNLARQAQAYSQAGGLATQSGAALGSLGSDRLGNIRADAGQISQTQLAAAQLAQQGQQSNIQAQTAANAGRADYGLGLLQNDVQRGLAAEQARLARAQANQIKSRTRTKEEQAAGIGLQTGGQILLNLNGPSNPYY